MIMKEAVLGGSYWIDWLPSEQAKPESERVMFEYRPLTNRERLEIADKVMVDANGTIRYPSIEIMKRCITGIRNLEDGSIDTFAKLMDHPGLDEHMLVILTIAAREIWQRQTGTGDLLKNSEAPSTAGAKAISTKEQPDS
jgi:hypothetical protein